MYEVFFSQIDWFHHFARNLSVRLACKYFFFSYIINGWVWKSLWITKKINEITWKVYEIAEKVNGLLKKLMKLLEKLWNAEKVYESSKKNYKEIFLLNFKLVFKNGRKIDLSLLKMN